MRKMLHILILVASLLQSPSLFAEEKMVIGKPAPAFTLSGADGKTYSLSQFKGKTVVLEWLNHECPFVKKHYNPSQMNMQKLQKIATSKGVIWLSINSSAEGKQGHLTAADALLATTAKGASPTAVLLDPSGVVGKSYGARTTPHMFIIDGEGTLRYMGAIDSTPSTDPSDIPEAKNYVSQALTELEAGKGISEPTTEPYGCSVKYGA